MAGLLNQLLAHPLTRNRSVDDPGTTALRRSIIREKPFLLALYREWYQILLHHLPDHGAILEIGSGAGFLGEYSSRVITSEVFQTPGVSLIADCRQLPFATGALAAVTMTDVLHHIPDVTSFFSEAARCIKPGGIMAMIEPWKTPWSELVYRNLHSEPFEPMAGWDIPTTGPLSGANGALPWIIFQRDRARFESEFPQWQLQKIQPMMPLAYLVSGGVSLRSMAPAVSYGLVRAAEKLIGEARFAMFALIVLVRKP
ncbi:MAG: class I SAM-dependent methyltransferase [Candidatus Gottesmanbacteria bacterium]|nr:class I SAM-dependent methyltransferase [Candidatus Gottesmanbacteria bacterium]